jgi:hypothetical protein
MPSWPGTSPDDDGLEPLGSPIEPARLSQVQRVQSSAPQGPRRKRDEATLVLRHRQLDSLRAEVRKQQKAQARERSLLFVFWGLAGGVAVMVGAFLARGVTSSRTSEADRSPAAMPVSAPAPEPPRSAAPASVPLERSSGSVAPAAEARKVPSGAEPSPEAELPPREAVSRSSAPSPSRKRAALSLDQLPTE